MATVEHRKPWVRRSAGILAGCGVALSAFGLTGGVAHAVPAPTSHWCPGSAWDPSWGTVYNWDWNQCHDWQGHAGQSFPAGAGPWGPPPAWAPPAPPPPAWAPGAQLMWNPTGPGNWGFWNHGIWTPV
ncbi:hypothetical protein U8D42_02915 [Mycobacterium europaeum]|uniref:Pilin n=1 Tax=Mycobacterium europaeum TaxID=761804 RepID=A0A0U1DDP5_9MYCO|nr:hypothetical protein [Mycobacterium europaeum]MEA1159491.1 hypothetical protein [Mycobacterium europaeum]CQD13576.1 secreted protein antigen [Mycobacterium europaeum]